MTENHDYSRKIRKEDVHEKTLCWSLVDLPR